MNENITKQKFENQECPTCGENGKFNPPPLEDKKRRKLIIDFVCPNGHKFSTELDLK